MSRIKELVEEFRLVFSGRGSILDSVLPAIIFLVVNTVSGFQAAMWSSMIVGFILMVTRLITGQSWKYALGGIAGAGVAIGLVLILERSEAYFLPTLVSSGLTVFVLAGSLIFKRALAAYSSHITRGWELQWYWHEKVYPAYREVTLFWLLYSLGKLIFQIYFYIRGEIDTLTWLNTLLGWPALILILAGSYLFGLWRLKELHGPSVEEFMDNKQPPWQSQQRGF